jgi:hypothetical protein
VRELGSSSKPGGSFFNPGVDVVYLLVLGLLIFACGKELNSWIPLKERFVARGWMSVSE